MNKKLTLVLPLLLFPFSVTGCEPAEDGDINQWVGEYEFTSNYCEHWHRYLDGTKREIKKPDDFKKDSDPFFIYPDKTWKIQDSKGLGPTGKIKCYKDHINLLDFSMDYRIESKFNFKLVTETTEVERKFLQYRLDESEGRIVGDYDFDIRVVRFWLK